MSWAPFRWFRRTRLSRVAPRRVLVTVDGEVAVRVAGEAHGWVRCGGRFRGAWGSFDHTFRVRGVARDVAVVAAGLGGRVRQTVEWRPIRNLRHAPAPVRPPAGPRRMPPVRLAPVEVRVRVGSAQPQIEAPSVPVVPAARLSIAIVFSDMEVRHEQLRRDAAAERS